LNYQSAAKHKSPNQLAQSIRPIKHQLRLESPVSIAMICSHQEATKRMDTPMKPSILLTCCLAIVLWLVTFSAITHLAFSQPLLDRTPIVAQVTDPLPVNELPRSQTLPTPQTTDSSAAQEETATNTEEKQPATSEDEQEAANRSTPESPPSESAGPYDMEAIREFNRALYGS
jgi:hypothetical protein